MKYVIYFILTFTYFLYVVTGIFDAKYQKTQYQQIFNNLGDKFNKTDCSEVVYINYMNNFQVVGVFNSIISLLPLKYCFDVAFGYRPIIIRGPFKDNDSLSMFVFVIMSFPFAIIAFVAVLNKCAFITYPPLNQLVKPLLIFYLACFVMMFTLGMKVRGEYLWNIITDSTISKPNHELPNHPIDKIVTRYSLLKKLYNCDETLCPICYGELEEMTKLVVFLCGHYFHPKCITTWFDQEDTCPMCRVIFKQDVPKELDHNLNAFQYLGVEILL
ncbi:MAG: putative E3 ubiquitin-protein ligase-like protein [Harvfovirus sp.]|uniref:Putative E3 ubiquitin-protein ligase-like protein n=1 Tax=Harvfovirus sp. TaxID=2487768 RepID=A0A3G5A1U1_9VIRU|nr:MAG: putative E3 ubiquitin-protein ligase-like protein [Harvfovirus sp.]